MKKSLFKKTTAYLSAIVLAASSFSFNASAKKPQNCFFDAPVGKGMYVRPVIIDYLKGLCRNDINVPQVQIDYNNIFLMLNVIYSRAIDFENGSFLDFELAKQRTGSKEGLLNDPKIVMMRASSKLFSEPLRILCNFVLTNERLTAEMYKQLNILIFSVDMADAMLYLAANQDVTSQECIEEYFIVLENVAKQLYNVPSVHEALMKWYVMVIAQKQILGIHG